MNVLFALRAGEYARNANRTFISALPERHLKKAASCGFFVISRSNAAAVASAGWHRQTPGRGRTRRQPASGRDAPSQCNASLKVHLIPGRMGR
jgi:hypothetical protein